MLVLSYIMIAHSGRAGWEGAPPLHDAPGSASFVGVARPLDAEASAAGRTPAGRRREGRRDGGRRPPSGRAGAVRRWRPVMPGGATNEAEAARLECGDVPTVLFCYLYIVNIKHILGVG